MCPYFLVSRAIFKILYLSFSNINLFYYQLLLHHLKSLQLIFKYGDYTKYSINIFIETRLSSITIKKLLLWKYLDTILWVLSANKKITMLSPSIWLYCCFFSYSCSRLLLRSFFLTLPLCFVLCDTFF